MRKASAGQEKLKDEKNFLEKQEEYEFVVKASKKRWLIITLFMYYACLSNFQWIEYCSITPAVVRYYNVTTLAVDWTSIIYMALYPFLVIPASHFINEKGLRAAALIGCISTLLGAILKVFSIGRNLFIVVLMGQTIVSASQLVIVCLPPKIASIWFKPNEASTVCSLGLFGVQLGCGLGYILPPIMVKDSLNLYEIATGLKLMCWALTISMIPVTLAVIIFFSKQPYLPPSIAQAKIRKERVEFERKEFFASLKYLFTDKGFVIHMIAYGINVGVICAIGTLHTQFILQFFENATEHAGQMGFVMVVTGLIGSVLFGIILDRYHKYKESAIIVYIFSAVSVVGLIFSLRARSLICSYLTCALLGLFANAYMLVGFEIGIELTFPIDESTTSGILFAVSQILGTGLTIFLGYFNLWFGGVWSLISQVILLFLGAILTAFVPNKLKRQEANKNEIIMTENRKETHYDQDLYLFTKLRT